MKRTRRFKAGDTVEMFKFLEEFVELLAADRYSDALVMIENSPYNAAELKSTIADYFEDVEVM